jgi:hypothetical protein
MVPEFYEIANSERTEDEVGALRQVKHVAIIGLSGPAVATKAAWYLNVYLCLFGFLCLWVAKAGRLSICGSIVSWALLSLP